MHSFTDGASNSQSKYYDGAVRKLNAEVNQRGEKREKRRVVSLQPTSTQEQKNFMKETSEPYMNDEELNHYTSRLKDGLQKFLQPAESCFISLALNSYLLPS